MKHKKISDRIFAFVGMDKQVVLVSVLAYIALC